MKGKPVILPSGVSMQQNILTEEGNVFIFSHIQWGEIGRIVISETEDYFEINHSVTETSDPVLQEKYNHFMESIVKSYTTAIEDPNNRVSKNDDRQAAITVEKKHSWNIIKINCPKCNKQVGSYLFCPEPATPKELEDYAIEIYEKKDTPIRQPLWLISALKNDAEGRSGKVLVLKVWPLQEYQVPHVMSLQEVPTLLHDAQASHCS